MELLKVDKSSHLSASFRMKNIWKMSYNLHNPLYTKLSGMLVSKGYRLNRNIQMSLCMWSIGKHEIINFTTFDAGWCTYDVTFDDYIKIASKNRECEKDLMLDKMIEHFKYNYITVKTALLLLVHLLNSSDIKPMRKELLLNELMLLKRTLDNITTFEDELTFIKTLETPQECLNKEICYKMIHMMTETYHIAKIIKYFKSHKKEMAQPTFILGFTINDCNYTYCDKEDFEKSLKTPSGHSQLYLIENNIVYHYDPDRSSTLEQHRINLICKEIGYRFKSLTYEYPSIQDYLNDIYCIFHTFRCMLILVEERTRNREKLGKLILKKYPHNQVITKRHMEIWIDTLSSTYL